MAMPTSWSTIDSNLHLKTAFHSSMQNMRQ